MTQEVLPAIIHCAWSNPDQLPAVEEIVISNMATLPQELRDTTESLQEMTKLIKAAVKAVELADITDQIVEMRSDLTKLKTEFPRAAGDIDDVIERCAVVSAANLAKMAQLAGG